MKGKRGRTFFISYGENLECPTTEATKTAISDYCEKEKLQYFFGGITAHGNNLVEIDGRLYEAIREKDTGANTWRIRCKEY